MACWTRLYHSLVDLGEKDALSQRSQNKVMYTDELKQQLFSAPEPKAHQVGLKYTHAQQSFHCLSSVCCSSTSSNICKTTWTIKAKFCVEPLLEW